MNRIAAILCCIVLASSQPASAGLTSFLRLDNEKSPAAAPQSKIPHEHAPFVPGAPVARVAAAQLGATPPAPAAEEAGPQPNGAIPVQADPIVLYPCVKYSDPDDIHPCAVRMLVAVKDPRETPPQCECSTPACVYVEICVPPYECKKFEVKRKDHSKVEYDYGDYEVEITSKNGVVYVDYDN